MKYKKEAIAFVNVFLICALCLNGLFTHFQAKPAEEATPSFEVAAKIRNSKSCDENIVLITDEAKQNKNKLKVQKMQAAAGDVTAQQSHASNTAVFLQIREELQLYQSELFYLLC